MLPFEVATVGDNCIDRFLPPIGLSVVGGNALNVAVHLRRLGRASAYFGAVGLDADGQRTIAALRAADVVTDYVEQLSDQTAYTEITVDATGDRLIGFEEFGACRHYRPAASALAVLARMRHVHIGWMPHGDELVKELRAAGVSLSKDISVNAGAGGLSVAFTSADGGEGRAEDIAQRLLAEGAAVAVVTLGAAGSFATDGRVSARTGIRPVAVVDTTGAGDTFIAGFIARRLDGGSLQQCLEAGRDAAAETCGYFGGFPQTPQPLSKG